MAQYDVVVKAVDQTKTAFRGVESGLKNIQTRAKAVNDQIDSLTSTVGKFGAAATAALGLAARSAITFANEVDDIANATDISARAILGFSAAVQDAGGNSQKALDSILKLNQNISEAAGGSDGLRKAFAEVGVSLTDLANLSTEALLGRVVEGLGAIEDKSKQAALGAELLGKGFKGVSASLVAANIGKFTEESQKAAAAQKQIADATAVVEQAFGRLRNRIAEAIAPLAQYVNSLRPDQIDRFVNALVGLTGAIVGLTAGLKVLQGIAAILGTLGGAIALVSGGFARLAANALTVGNLFKNLGLLLTVPLVNGASILARFSLGWLVLKGTLAAIAAPIGAIILGVTQIGAVAGLAALAVDSIFDTKIIDTFVSGVKRAYNAVKEFTGFGDAGAGGGRGGQGGPTAAELAKYQAEQDALKKAREAAAGGGGPVRDVVNKTLETFNEGIATARKEYNLFLTLLNSPDPAVAAGALEKVNAAAKTLQITLSNDLILRNFNEQLKDSSEQLRQQQVVYKDANNVIREYNIEIGKQTLELQKQQVIYSDTGRILGAFNLELSKQELELRKTSTVLGDNATQQRQFNIELEKSRQSQQQQVITLGLTAKAYEDGRISVQEYLKALQGLDATLLSAEQRQLQFNDAITKGMNDAAMTAEMAGRAMNEAYATGDMARYLQIYEQYKNVLGTTATGELAAARKGAKDELQTMRDRTTALKTLTEEYKANGGTGSAEYRKVAEALGMSTDAIDRMVNVHGSAIDRMVEDARFYENSISNAANTFSSEFTRAFMEGRNTLDSFRNFFSNIANDIANRIIKQQLADPIADALSGIVGKVIGGFGGGGGGGGGFFSSIISSVGGFLGDIFGGFFADGGTLGAGQFGIVGEAGPELITGPANITPMDDVGGSAGNLQVVFQIQAIDTQTGAQFLLQNKPLITSMITQAYNSRGRRGPLD